MKVRIKIEDRIFRWTAKTARGFNKKQKREIARVRKQLNQYA